MKFGKKQKCLYWPNEQILENKTENTLNQTADTEQDI